MAHGDRWVAHCEKRPLSKWPSFHIRCHPFSFFIIVTICLHCHHWQNQQLSFSAIINMIILIPVIMIITVSVDISTRLLHPAVQILIHSMESHLKLTWCSVKNEKNTCDGFILCSPSMPYISKVPWKFPEHEGGDCHKIHKSRAKQEEDGAKRR